MYMYEGHVMIVSKYILYNSLKVPVQVIIIFLKCFEFLKTLTISILQGRLSFDNLLQIMQSWLFKLLCCHIRFFYVQAIFLCFMRIICHVCTLSHIGVLAVSIIQAVSVQQIFFRTSQNIQKFCTESIHLLQEISGSTFGR